MENQQGAPGPTGQSSSMDPKTVGIIAYITLIGTIIALVINNNDKNSYASFHIRQALGLGLSLIVISFIAIIPILGWLIYALGGIFLFICWIIGLVAALNGEEKLVPIIGEKYQEWFSGL
ncbi:DUF4870 domain-containing protein [Portibacter marinus]|uniref:DUF4870 domain-containing protein n=1 Tax=Portibacter marinus TaxID=2898660 RepID=UPI001F2C2E79|nr:DUF4870 domain-containing protein [Portibacter marinus]